MSLGFAMCLLFALSMLKPYLNYLTLDWRFQNSDFFKFNLKNARFQ